MENVSLKDYAGQGEEIRSFLYHLKQNQAPHAILISGPEGVGKRTLALLISQYMLCESGNPPCGECRACIQALKYEHPDQVLIRKGVPLSSEIKEGRATIPVEDIREMIRITGATPARGGKRTVIIHDAEAMTPQAQNALLKTLEEPPEGTCFLIVTSHPESILNTVTSRCARLHIHAWPYEYITRRLTERGTAKERAEAAADLAEGSVGRAIRLAEDEEYWKARDEVIHDFFFTTRRSETLNCSNRWKNRKGEADQMLGILESVVGHMISARFGGEKNRMESQLPPQWIRFSREASAEAVCALYDRITETRKELQYSVNFQAVTEQLLLSFIGEGNKWLQ